MKEWALADLVRDLKFKVAFNEGQTDLEYRGPTGDVDRHFKDYINEAYVDEYNEAVIIGDPRWFYATQTLVWTSGSTTLELPTELDSKWHIRIFDITDDPVGVPFWTSDWPTGGAAVIWRDRRTFQWMDSAGPPRDLSLQLTYCGTPVELVGDGDVPVLFPAQFRHIISWSAAIKLRMIGDDGAPGGWVQERNRIRQSMQKFLSMRGPMQTGATTITNSDPDSFHLLY